MGVKRENDKWLFIFLFLMEKIFLIFPKTHVNLSPELGVCTILNSFIYNYFSSISSNFFESKILITSAGLKKKSIEFGFPSRRRENEPLLHSNSQDQTINLIPKMQKWKRIRTGWCNLFRNRVCGKERGCGSSQTSPASGHDVVPSSLSVSFSIPSLWSLGSFEIVAASFTTAFPPRRQTSRAHSFTLSCPDVTSY